MADRETLIREIILSAKDQATKQVQGVDAQLRKLGSTTGAIGRQMSALPAAFGAAFSVAAVVDFSKGVVDLAGRLADLEERTGLNAQLLSGLKNTLEQAGTSVDAFARGIFQAQRRLGEVRSVTDPAAIAIRQLGLNIDELRNSTPQRFFELIAAALGKIENPTQRAAIAAQLLGSRLAQELVPALTQAAGKTEEFMRQGMSRENIKQLDDFGDAMTSLRNTVQILAAAPLARIAKDLGALFGMGSERDTMVAKLREIQGRIQALDRDLARLANAKDPIFERQRGQMIALREALGKEQLALERKLAGTAGGEAPAAPPRFVPPPDLAAAKKAQEEYVKLLKEQFNALDAMDEEEGKARDEAIKKTREQALAVIDLANSWEQMRIAERQAMDDKDRAEWLTLDEDLAKISDEAKKAAEAWEELRNAQRGAMDDSDRAEWLTAAEDMARISKEKADEIDAEYQRLADGMLNGMTETFRGIMLGTQSFGDAMKSLFQNIALSLVDTLTRELASEPLKDALKQLVEPLKKSISDSFTNLLSPTGSGGAGGGFDLSALTSSISQMFSGLMDSLMSSMAGASDMLMQLLSSLFSSLMGFFVMGRGGLLPGGFVPVRAFAAGGVVDRPTFGFIGEGHRPEAVVPLPDGKRIPVEMRGDRDRRDRQPITIVNQMWDPSTNRVTRQEVLSFFVDAVDHSPSFRNKLKGVR